ncbi:MAG: hypothetical protein QOD06_347 [Candidatus Binatota bacterium]|jgi:hypothetical protein|nr:hypothetical protein [Candidatus Binatota bacterium]
MKRLIVFAVFAMLAAPPFAAAYFELDLANGGKMFADTYRQQGTELLLFRGSGTVRVNRADVTAIREHEGRLGEATSGKSVAPPPAKESPAAAAKVPAAEAPTTEPQAASAPTTNATTPGDLRERETALTRDLILGYRDRLFAQNRGDDPKSIEKLEKKLDGLKQQRDGVRKELGGS